ncbi:MAG: hypothetical protein IAG13_38090, partial [Deltaproteobacteria bacterium]|nr:hypothetical protein [Nannocystaceae bacterium]
MYLRRVAIVSMLVGCGGDVGNSDPVATSESGSGGSSGSGPSTSTTTDTSSGTGSVDDSSGSSDAETSGESSSGEPSATLRTILIDDLDDDGQWWAYMVEWSGDEVGAPIRVHGPTLPGSTVQVDAVSSDLLAIETTHKGGGQAWSLVEIDGSTVGPSGPLALEPAPLASVPSVRFVPEDSRAVFSASELVDGPRSLWSTSYEGSVAQPPERVSPPSPAANYLLFELAPAGDAVLASRFEADDVSNLVWMPLAPADPDAAIELTSHTESWQSVSIFGFGADGESVHYLASISEGRNQLFVDDLDAGTPAVPVHPELAAEQSVRWRQVAPGGSAIAYRVST